MSTRKAQDRVMNVFSVWRIAMQGITMEVREGDSGTHTPANGHSHTNTRVHELPPKKKVNMIKCVVLTKIHGCVKLHHKSLFRLRLPFKG